MDENVQNTENQGTTPDGQETQQATEQENTNATAPDEQSGTGEGTAQQSAEGENGENVSEEPFLSVRFNHEDVNLNRDDAISYAQKGMKYSPIHDRLSFLASKSGKDIDGFIEGLMAADEAEYRSQLSDKLGGDNELIEQLMSTYRADRKKEFDDFTNTEKEKLLKSNESRLADEFAELKREVPEFSDKSFADLPESVKKAAAGGKNLTVAYLLHQRKQEKQIAEAEKKEKEVNSASAGSVSTNEAVDTTFDSFMSGLWGR